jgi:anti-anti-sigma factor
MPIQNWSDNILVVDLADDPAYTDDLNALFDTVSEQPKVDALLNFSSVSFLNSSNIAKLLKLRKILCVNHRRKLKLCGINTHVWGVFLTTGLDKIFDFADDVASGLASLQMNS